MGGGLSVGPGAPQRKISNEFPQILQLFQHTFGGPGGGTLGQFTNDSPLLSLLSSSALGANQPGGVSSSLSKWLPGLNSSYNKNVAPIIASGGALTKEQTRDVNQQTDAGFAARNTAGGNAAFTTEFQNRDSAKQQRYSTALGEASQIQGLEGGIQSAQSGGLNQLSTAEGALTGNYAQITDPLLSYAGNLFGENLQATQTTQLANQNKGAAIPGTAGSVIGNILGGIASSDERLKEKIKGTGEKGVGGVPLKTFRYKGDPDKQDYIGYLSKDVKKKFPGSVVRMPGGMEGVRFPFFPSSTGDDQTIRAKTGEYVIPAEVVRKKGTAYFDRMVKAGTGEKPGGIRTPSGLIGYRRGGRVRGGRGRNDHDGDAKDLNFAPLSAYSPGKGNRRMEGRFETSSGDPMHTFESFLRGHSKYVTGATNDHRNIGKTVMRHIGNRLVPVKITDFGPGVKGIDIPFENPHFARSFPFQGQVEKTGRTLGHTVASVGRTLGHTAHRMFPSSTHAVSHMRRHDPSRYAAKLARAHAHFGIGEGHPFGGGGVAPGTFGGGGPGAGPGVGPLGGSPVGGGFPSATGGTPPDSSGNSPDISGSIPWNVPDTGVEPWTYQDFTAYEGGTTPIDYGGSGGGIQ
jgi:hypothetical protein